MTLTAQLEAGVQHLTAAYNDFGNYTKTLSTQAPVICNIASNNGKFQTMVLGTGVVGLLAILALGSFRETCKAHSFDANNVSIQNPTSRRGLYALFGLAMVYLAFSEGAQISSSLKDFALKQCKHWGKGAVNLQSFNLYNCGALGLNMFKL